MPVRFVTSNEGKADEAREYLDDVERVDYDYTEVQGDLATVAAEGAREAFEALGGTDPVLVDDAGLFVRTLGGFPGPYSSYVEDTLGVERVWRVCEAEDDRRAHFRTVLAYAHRPDDADADEVRVETFEGSVPGTIVAPRGDGGFGYDPIFEHDGTTMAEMTTAEKNAISHRGRALAKFADWLAGEPAETKGAK
jgi:XTP/dITP diphosphohydrolase